MVGCDIEILSNFLTLLLQLLQLDRNNPWLKCRSDWSCAGPRFVFRVVSFVYLGKFLGFKGMEKIVQNQLLLATLLHNSQPHIIRNMGQAIKYNQI